MARITKSIEYLRHNFTPEERLTMGSELAAAHNTMSAIEEEENHIKATFKERKASVEQSIGKLSREIGSGFTMQNIDCKLAYDEPNVGEVSYVRIDNGEVAKTRPMTVSERQQEIEFVPPAPVEKSEEAIADFFIVETVDPADSKCDECECSFNVHLKTCSQFVDPHPEHARQEPLITMGDAKKKGSRKKSEEAQFDPTPIHPQPDMDPDDSMPF